MHPAEKPGDCVSVDQLESSVPGLIAQDATTQKCKLTRKRYKHATVFVDHYSRLSYVHVHQHTDTEDALEAKEAFEAHAQERGVTIKHYHCDNGIFRSRDFVHHVHRKK